MKSPRHDEDEPLITSNLRGEVVLDVVEHHPEQSEGDDVFCDTVKQISGYVRLPGTRKNYFFWFFESRSKPSTDPLVLWLTGGPGGFYFKSARK